MVHDVLDPLTENVSFVADWIERFLNFKSYLKDYGSLRHSALCADDREGPAFLDAPNITFLRP